MIELESIPGPASTSSGSRNRAYSFEPSEVFADASIHVAAPAMSAGIFHQFDICPMFGQLRFGILCHSERAYTVNGDKLVVFTWHVSLTKYCALSSMDAPRTMRPYPLFDKGIRARDLRNCMLLKAQTFSQPYPDIQNNHFVPVYSNDSTLPLLSLRATVCGSDSTRTSY